MGTRETSVRSGFGCRPIGTIRTGFTGAVGTPVQPAFARDARGEVVVDERFGAALDDIDGFERVWLIYWMDRAAPFAARVIPYRDTREHGLFSTRSPVRPNPIGLSVVRLLRREGRVLHVADVDVLDGTPLLDIKPYLSSVPAESLKRGWLDEAVSKVP